MSLRELEQRQARELAGARGEYYVSVPHESRPTGPLSEKTMRLLVDGHLAAGIKPLVLKVVEDYGR